MITLHLVELGVLGPLQVRRDGTPVAIPGAKPRAILTMLGLHGGAVVSAETLFELLWGENPPRTAAKALQTHISSLRRALGDGFVLTTGTGWALAESEVDASRYRSVARLGRDAAAAGDISQAVACFEEALALWRGIPELPEGRRGASERTRWVEGHAALVEDRADALLATGRAAEVIGDLEAAVADAPLRERRWGQLMLALYRVGRQGDALSAYQRARSVLADELGIDPGPELRRLESAIVSQNSALEVAGAQSISSVMRAVTFLLTDIEGSTAAWEAEADAMASALARHDELVEQVVTSRGGRLIKTRGEGDATFSVFERPSAAAAAAIELQEAIAQEPWTLRDPIRIRVALHTGEVELRDGDYFGRAVNRAARLKSLAAGGQTLCSGATAELVIDSLPEHVMLADLGLRELRNLTRPEHVFELRLQTAEVEVQPLPSESPIERPGLPSVLIGTGPFVGRGDELERLYAAWQTALGGGARAALIAGEPGVGKTRLAGEWSRQAYEQGAVVLYGRCDEDLGAPYQPFAEALRSLVPCVGTGRLRGLRGVEALLSLVPGLTDVVPDLAAPTRADADTERYALFDAVVALLEMASTEVPIVLVLDDLHWAAKPTLLLLRHLLRFGDNARVQIVGTYRSTDLDRSHPLAAMLADLHRDGTANRINLSGLDEDDVTAYVAEAGYDDEELGRALASVTGGNPFFLIEALRHVDESGGVWDPSTLPQGVREAVSRRLTRLPIETNNALAAAAVVGSRFALDLVERVVGEDLVDAFDEAAKAGIVIEEPGGRYRFNHALIRQSLLAELPSVRRMRLHQRIATTLEDEPGDDDDLLAELAHHYFECAWAGNAAKAVEYCRRAADQAMTRLSYEGAADLYGHALHAMDELDDEVPDRDDQIADLLVARCEALLAAGDVASAAGAVAQLQQATVDSARLAAWATCFDGQLSISVHPERLDDVEAALGAAAHKLAAIDDAAGEAKAHTVRAQCLARLGRIGDCEIALDDALTAARRARDHRRVNAVLAGAPLAALWGPNPVPRAGGRCLDVVRLLRITTDSPAVEATSTRCQAVLEAFRGRDAAARRMIDSARRTVTELGLRHALLEVEQFAGIVELVLDDAAAAEPHLRQAYKGFRRMGLDADTAETAALLGRACLALDRDAEADELCMESERLAGHALKASIAWRVLRAQLLSRSSDHDEAQRVAQAAVTLAERTDGLVDHGDACLSLAKVLDAVGDSAGARAAAERAAGLYERKGAAALAEKAQRLSGARAITAAPAAPEVAAVEFDTACVRVGDRVKDAADREAWDEFEQLFAPGATLESRRKIVGFPPGDFPAETAARMHRRTLETGGALLDAVVIAVRGERLALSRLAMGTADGTPGAPHDEFLHIYAIDDDGRVALQVWFDLEDIDAAIAELDALYARFEQERLPARRLENAASRVFENEWSHFAARDWDALAAIVADDYSGIDHRRIVRAENQHGRDVVVRDLQAAADVGFAISMVSAMATRGERLVLARVRAAGRDPKAIQNDALNVVEIDADERILATVTFDLEDFDAAVAELDARYLAGEAAPYAHTWSVVAAGYAGFNRRELPAFTPGWVNIDHRRGAGFAPGDMIAYMQAAWDDSPDTKIYIGAVHRLSEIGAVVTHQSRGISQEGFEAEWRDVYLLVTEGDMVSRSELFDEADLDAAIATFDQLGRPARRLENAASRVFERMYSYVAAGDWDAVAQITADEVSVDDRRRVVNAGILHGRDANIKDAQATADVGFTMTMLDVLATRGGRLALTGVRVSGRDPQAIQNDALQIIEIDAEERIASVVVVDLDDFDAALAELDARYVAGEAAAHAHTWSLVAASYAAINRHEQPATTPDWINVDHRQEIAMGPDDLVAYIDAGADRDQEINTYVEAVHRLDRLGVVITYASHETSQQGLDAEWRGVAVFTVDGELVNRTEVFNEADVDAALARFEELRRPALRLENAASQVYERMWAYFRAQDWVALTGLVAGDEVIDDRRRVVNGGVRHGRNAGIQELRAAADIGFAITMVDVKATRGNRLALTRVRASGRDPDTIQNDVLQVVEIDANEQIARVVTFDLDDFDAAIAELDARYIAGEAASYPHTWTVIAESYASVKRQEFPAISPDSVFVDHRRATAFGQADLSAYLHAGWDLGQRIQPYLEAVHLLSDLGAVCSFAAQGVSHDGFDAEWRGIDLVGVSGDMIDRHEFFDEADLDAAIARFEQLTRPAPRLENTASRANARFVACVNARDWAAIASILADDHCSDDRRRVTGTGARRGRDAEIENMRAVADLGANTTVEVIATRGDRLVLTRARASTQQGFVGELLVLIETDLDGRMAATVLLDLDDIDAAFEELDARYVAGEATVHAHTWSTIARGFAALNRGELPAVTQDLVNDDHRHAASIAPGEGIAYFRASWELAADLNVYIEAVHRLSDLGAVFTHVGKGTSRDGFEAEWRTVDIMTVEGDLISRGELFDEADLEAAIARFEELSRQTPRLENAASRMGDRFLANFAASNWDAMAEILADDFANDDRRRVVSTGVFHGRDAQMANTRAIAELWSTNVTQTVLATRGKSLALARVTFARHDEEPGAFVTEVLIIDEIDVDEKIASVVVFDAADFDPAVAELDLRYLAGEAAAHSHVWSVIAGGFGSLTRSELPLTTPECVSIDHRRTAAFAPGELNAYTRAAFELTAEHRIYVEAVHGLNGVGVVCTHVTQGFSHDGFAAEWREVVVLAVDGDAVNRCELFDEADLDAALTRFEELRPQAPRLENAASHVYERFQAYFAASHWDAIADMLTADLYSDDRRAVVGGGSRPGRDALIEDLRAVTDVEITNSTSDAIAIRGGHLVLARARYSRGRGEPDPFHVDFLQLVEIDAEDRITAFIAFDPNDIEAAFEELDARYVAGEGAAHARTWSAITRGNTAANQNARLPMTPDASMIDHRLRTTLNADGLAAYIRATWDLTPELHMFIESVHRLNDVGAVVTHASRGTSQDDFEAEWRQITLFTLEGDLCNRCEIFDEADLDAALARFDELSRPTPQLENVATQVGERFVAHYAARRWDAMAEILATNFLSEDRRRVVGAGVRNGRDAQIADMRAIAALDLRNLTSANIATRGSRLVLQRGRMSFGAQGSEAFLSDLLAIVELDAEERMVALLSFDLDDVTAAFNELDARYLAGEAGAYAHTWSVISEAYAAFNRHELPAADLVTVDRRRATPFESSTMAETLGAIWDLTPDLVIRIEAVHRLSSLGAVVTHVQRGTSREGFDAEWRSIELMTVHGGRIKYCEIFDEADLDAALARFDELSTPTPQLENAASRVDVRFFANFRAHNWTALAAILADEMFIDDRRRVVNAGLWDGRDAVITNLKVFAEAAPDVTSVIASRGERLAMSRIRSPNRDSGQGAFGVEMLSIVEINADERIVAHISYDPDDIGSAIAELDARYLAGEAAAHSDAWSGIAAAYAAVNRHELPPTTPDWVNIDHRRGRAFAPGDLEAYLHATWDLAPDVSVYVESVHRLGNLGGVVTHRADGTSQEGFDAQRREVILLTFEAGMVSHFEVFDETDLDGALARFDGLDRL